MNLLLLLERKGGILLKANPGIAHRQGFADLIFLPKKEYPEMPALLVELKWNQSADAAIKQIKNKNYTNALERFSGNILLVGINYSKKEKKHECVIEKHIL